jgi:hypothetical protein
MPPAKSVRVEPAAAAAAAAAAAVVEPPVPMAAALDPMDTAADGKAVESAAKPQPERPATHFSRLSTPLRSLRIADLLIHVYVLSPLQR